jgi:hypothetical protein
MADETPPRPAGTPDRRGHPGGGGGYQSPLQARAAFIKNWDWQSVAYINRGTCERGRAQHGFNSETADACEREWEQKHHSIFALGEVLDFLKSFHRRAPFLFFNGNTFAAIGRQLMGALFGDLPTSRQREIASAAAHYIAGVMDREAMVEMVNTLSQTTDFKPGDRVKTLRGSARGVVVRTAADGRIVWRLDGGGELLALPEDLLPE